MEISKEVAVAIIGVIPALAAPLFSSLLQRRGAAQKTRDVELLDKRVQIIERLLILDKHLSDERKKMLQAELANIAQDLVADRVRERIAGGVSVEHLSILRRFFLIYEQPTTRASIYRGFFWFFFIVSVFPSFPILFFTFSEQGIEGIVTALFPIASMFIFYGMIALFFRSAAVRQQKRAQTAAAEQVSISNEAGS